MEQRPTESHWLIEMIKEICARYQQEWIDLLSGEKPANYGQT